MLSEERYIEYTANLYLKIEQVGETFLRASREIDVTSQRLMPKFTNQGGPSMFTKVFGFDSSIQELPGLGPDKVTISGNTLTVDNFYPWGDVRQHNVFNLVPNDSKFNGRDTLYITLGHTGVYQGGSPGLYDSEPNAIVLVKK